MEKILAKALYDNTAESPDELAFRKGDIITVLHQNVAGSIGWWKCSLHGREGVAPANRLCVLSPSKAVCSKEADRSTDQQNVYQVPNVSRPPSDQLYEHMARIYKVPTNPLPVSQSPAALQPRQDKLERSSSPSRDKLPGSSSCSDVYDVPSLLRSKSAFIKQPHRPRMGKTSLWLGSSDVMATSSQNKIYSTCQDPSYDIPVPSSGNPPQRAGSGYFTLPKLSKSEWIYDVPVAPPNERASFHTSLDKHIYETLPPRTKSSESPDSSSPVYDCPRRLLQTPAIDVRDQEIIASRSCIYATPLGHKAPEAADPHRLSHNNSLRDHMLLDCRGDRAPTYDHPRRNLPWANMGDFSQICPRQVSTEENQEDTDNITGRTSRSPTVDSQRSSTSSTISSSSNSSCDSLAQSSDSAEPHREVVLSQEEASQQLMELQEEVCRAVSQLMVFVSSQWRYMDHLRQHLPAIRVATEGIAGSLARFLDFALDVRGNACRLTDTNLQSRLQKQLSNVENSGLVLKQAVAALGESGWSLSALTQDPGHPQTPDQLERFVMVARTVPEDIRRLVSILIANGKLLFRSAQRETAVQDSSHLDLKKDPASPEQAAEVGGEDNDYVQLQTKKEFEEQQKNVQGNVKSRKKGDTDKQQDSVKSPLTEHCRLYFGALQKAISVFVNSLLDGQPPERFIAHSKLVIMVGQRLVNSLYSEAQGSGENSDLLQKSNLLCALLKHLAVATKKAALHFPDKLALEEAQTFAKDLAQHAQHFRISLDR
ncbi:cas scaffolding protein family member 4 [Denticeps clupeoides]|uniref:cas scaffolding protein family member 4 n=1 Tax=Denticeps clupeoides TaxID=299321 RepID=UPI0010A4A97F|nr:cas scaffolding protein family member 4 [Denticeps clupeoides]